MAAHNIKIKMMIYGAVAGFLAGIVIVLFILIFNSFIKAGSFRHAAVVALYGENNLYSLLNLIPVLFSIAGGYAGRVLFIFRNKYEEEISQYKIILNRTVQFVQHIEKRKLDVPYVQVNGEKSLAVALESM